MVTAMAAPETPVLAPHYYRDNFLRLCDTVRRQYPDILSQPEAALLQRFYALPLKAQCLYVRLVSRSGPWFRESKLAYPELGACAPLLDELLQQDMAMQATSLGADDLGRLFTRPELGQIFSPWLESPRSGDKNTLLQAIDDLQLGDTMVMQAVSAFEAQRIIAPLGVDQLALFQLLFFGNRHQSLTDFVLQDLGVTRYYPYPLDPDQRLFGCRQALEEYLACAALGDQHRELLDCAEHELLPELAAQALAMQIHFPSSERRWQRLCNQLARDLERGEQWQLALQLYQRSQAHPARERSARILEKLGDLQEAVRLCQQIIDNPWCEAESEAAGRILPRLMRKLDGTRTPRSRDSFCDIELSIPRAEDCVELLVADHLGQRWRSVHFVENGLMNALFGLAFWQQIFQGVTGVFHHPFQSVPADMYEADFHPRREQAIATRLEELREGDLHALLEDAYTRYQGYQCRWVDWRRIEASLVSEAVRAIPSSHLLAIWERILFDPAENRRGFPDLVALGETEGDYALIEVKGPGDALQDNQKRWLRYFQANDIPAQVAWVTWCDD